MKCRCSICDFCLFCFFKSAIRQCSDRGWGSERGWVGREGEGRERVRQSGRLSGVWTCLAACTKQRKYREMCRFSSYRRSQAALNSHLHLIHAFVIFAPQSRCEAETGQQQTHKHGTGRCYALHPAQSAAAAACRYVYTRDDFFNYDFYSDVSYTLNLVKPWVCFSRCARANVTALFSLFEKAMLSASQNDITLRASYWPPRMKRPHLKTQSAVWMLLLGGGMQCSTDLMWRASWRPAGFTACFIKWSALPQFELMIKEWLIIFHLCCSCR